MITSDKSYQNNEWICVDLDADTTYLDVKDTLYIEKLDWVYYIKDKKR